MGADGGEGYYVTEAGGVAALTRTLFSFLSVCQLNFYMYSPHGYFTGILYHSNTERKTWDNLVLICAVLSFVHVIK